MGRPPRRTAYVVAKAQEKARLQAQREDHRKKTLEESAKAHIGKIIDNTKITDIADIVAAIGLTPFVKKIVDTIPDAVNIWTRSVGYVAAFEALPVSMLTGWFPFGQPQSTVEKSKDGLDTNVLGWITSFSIAYIIVRHAGQLFGLLEKGLASIVPMLLGVGL